MARGELITGTIILWGLPILLIHKSTNMSFIKSIVCATLSMSVFYFLSVFIMWGMTGLKYIWEANTFVEMLSRYMDAIGSIKGARTFYPI